MADTEDNQDQSMEEILQSIKRIIADDEDAAAGTEPAEAKDKSNGAKSDEEVNGSDVLELHDLVMEEAASEEKPATPEAKDDTDTKKDKAPEDPEDILNAIDEKLTNHPPKEAPPKEEVKAEAEKPAPKAKPKEPEPEKSDADVLADIDSLLSSETVEASSSALSTLKEQSKPAAEPEPMPALPPMQFRSGVSLEDLVLEALKPELKDWLNRNLPAIVERMVAAEIKKISDS